MNVDPRPAQDGDHCLVSLVSVAGIEGEPMRQDDINIEIGGADTFPAFSDALRGADTLIADATQPRMRERLPAWYRERINAPSFLLLPVQWQGQPLGLLYADHAQPGAIQVDEHSMDLLRTLRSQALMALRLPG